MTTETAAASDPTAELAQLKQEAADGPDEQATARQHAKGKLTARERIDLLLDEGSFQEIEALRRHRASGFGLENKRPYTDGVVTGWGTLHGRTVFVYAHDLSGSTSPRSRPSRSYPLHRPGPRPRPHRPA
ncbi:hypothetical protein SCALM49S_08585 [Streptomyces californicus]